MKIPFFQNKDASIVRDIQSGNTKVLECFQKECKKYFQRYCNKKHYYVENKENTLFHDAFFELWLKIDTKAILVENNTVYIKKGSENIEPMTSKLLTYFIGIVKKKIRKSAETEKNIWIDMDVVNIEIECPDEVENLKEQIVAQCVEQLSKGCREILKQFYYEKKTLDEILETSENYNDKNALKTRKYKCMQILKDRILTNFDKFKLRPYTHERRDIR